MRKIDILESDTAGSLFEKMSFQGAELLIETIRMLEKGNLKRIKQDERQASYAGIIKKSEGKIDWNNSSKNIFNLVRGMNPWPVAYTYIKSKMLKVYKAKVSNAVSEAPGEILSVSPFIVGCGNKTSLELLEVQIEGKRRMAAQEFARGQRISKNESLGDE